MKKLDLSKLLMLSAFAVFMTSCTSDEIQTENLAAPSVELHQKDGDLPTPPPPPPTPNQNEPIIVKPPRD